MTAGEQVLNGRIPTVTLRALVILLAAIELGFIMAVVPGWTPFRALLGALGLGAGSAAALVIGFRGDSLIGRRGLRRWLLGLLVLILFAGPVLGWIGAGISDPTQARPSDLNLSVVCRPSTDGKSLTAHVEFRWNKVDLWPNGIGRNQGHDVVGIELWSYDDTLETAPLDGGHLYPYLYWSYRSGPESLAVEGLPDAGFGREAQQQDGGNYGVPLVYPTDAGSGQLEVSRAAVQAGRTYSADWTFGWSDNATTGLSEGGVTLQELSPALVLLAVDYGHGQRFVTHAFSACGAPLKKYPSQSEPLNGQY